MADAEIAQLGASLPSDEGIGALNVQKDEFPKILHFFEISIAVCGVKNRTDNRCDVTLLSTNGAGTVCVVCVCLTVPSACHAQMIMQN